MNVPTAESFPLSLSCAHTHGHLYTIRIGRTILLIHTHTDVAFACLWHKVFLPPLWGELTSPASCREHSLFIDQGLAGWRERTERARDEEKWEKGEKLLQLWSKCCTEPCVWWGMWWWTASALSLFTQHRSFSSLVHRFWPVLSYTRPFYIHITMLLKWLFMLLLEAFASIF